MNGSRMLVVTESSDNGEHHEALNFQNSFHRDNKYKSHLYPTTIEKKNTVSYSVEYYGSLKKRIVHCSVR